MSSAASSLPPLLPVRRLRHDLDKDLRKATQPNTDTTNRMHTMAMAPAAPSDRPEEPGSAGTPLELPVLLLLLEATMIGAPEEPSPEELASPLAEAVEEDEAAVDPGSRELKTAPVEDDAAPVLLELEGAGSEPVLLLLLLEKGAG